MQTQSYLPGQGIEARRERSQLDFGLVRLLCTLLPMYLLRSMFKYADATAVVNLLSGLLVKNTWPISVLYESGQHTQNVGKAGK